MGNISIGELNMAMPPIDLSSMTERTKVMNMLRDGLIAHDTRIQNIRDDLNETRKDLDIIKEAAITGNPATGLISQAERIRNLESFTEGIKDTIRYWGRVIGGALLLNFIGFMAGIVIAVIRFLPVLEQLAKKP